ncbi:unnamed protein product [Darwinula stevensoni]|uniref:Uncharacterized protein n=1 Tax=Darwinula stevensoni TaxID=69355 RepID=A0A7R8X3V6_9CRUS|nr:unnamed protein product [Darwinula stevensoni]CAG0885393.1 unnamed protein product [Darwinula stevensoni]
MMCEHLTFRDKWVFFSTEKKNVFLMVGENKKDKNGKRLKVKGGRMEYPAIQAANLHPTFDHIELAFEGTQRSVVVSRGRITGSNKITSAIVKEYLQTRRLEDLVKAINRFIGVVGTEQRVAFINKEHYKRHACGTTAASQHSGECSQDSPFTLTISPPSPLEVTSIVAATSESSVRYNSLKRTETEGNNSQPGRKRKTSLSSWNRTSLEACYRGNHEIPMALLERSHSAARTFSTESKNLLKEKLIAEGEDRGSQLPIVVASSPNADIFNVSYIHAYKYEVIAGQHIVQARKEIRQEKGKGKDTCTCAIYWGLTETGKRTLALQNAKLQGVPYDALDVLEKYEELRENMENETEIQAAYGDILKDKKKHQVLKNIFHMGSEAVKEFLTIARELERKKPGSVDKRLYHLRHLGNPYITTNDFMENLRILKQERDIKKFGDKLSELIQKKTLIRSFARIAGVEEEEVFQRFSQQVTDESLKPFMSIKKKHETADEWKSYVELCISGEAIQRDAGDVEKYLLGLHAHQGRCEAEKNIPTAFCVDDIKHAAEIRDSLRRQELKTDVAILHKTECEGELFKHQHTYVVIGARHRIALPTSVLTRKEFLESFQKPNCWLLSNIRDLRKGELPPQMKLVTLVDLKFESQGSSGDTETSIELLPGIELETQTEYGTAMSQKHYFKETDEL